MENCSCTNASGVGKGFPWAMCGGHPKVLTRRGVNDMLGEWIHDETIQIERIDWDRDILWERVP